MRATERAPAGGIFTPLVPLGKAVEAGTQLGFVADPHGSGDTPVIASRPGVLIGRTNDAAADEGDGDAGAGSEAASES